MRIIFNHTINHNFFKYIFRTFGPIFHGIIDIIINKK